VPSVALQAGQAVRIDRGQHAVTKFFTRAILKNRGRIFAAMVTAMKQMKTNVMIYPATDDIGRCAYP
jgi:hypothetical protein